MYRVINYITSRASAEKEHKFDLTITVLTSSNITEIMHTTISILINLQWQKTAQS